jgi:acyl-CoA synthetase (AMP-forming)/AMP-acid ligase II
VSPEIGPANTLSEAIELHAAHRPGQVALVCGDRRVPWSELDARVTRVANALLAMGVGKGDKVALLAPDGVEPVEVIFGTMRAGAVAVPLPVLAHPCHLAQLIDDSDARVLFVAPSRGGSPSPVSLDVARRPGGPTVVVLSDAPDGYEAALASAPSTRCPAAVSMTDDCNIIYSSGTTGVPKGIVHTHASRAMFTYALRTMFRIDGTAVTLVTTPLYTNGTWMTLLPTVASGATTVVMPEFSARGALDLVERERCTHTFMVPTQLTMLLAEPSFDGRDLSSLRIVVSAAAPLRAETKREILRRMTKGLMELYGMTEGVGTVLQPEDMEAKLTSVGRPIPGTEIRIVDDGGAELPVGEVGEIVGLSPGVMRGYYKKPKESEALLWRDALGRPFVRTGDLGRLDADGFVYVVDRKKDMILTGGVNVYASDVEEAFACHPDVAEVAAIAVADEKWGETPLVLVVPRAGRTVDGEALRAWANQRLGKHQRASRVEVRESLPRNALGKVLKRELREAYTRKA